MGDNVGDDDGTSRTPLISLPCSTLPNLALLCLVLLCLLEFNVEEIMYKLFSLSIQRAMRRDRPTTPGPMRSTLPNTDQTTHSPFGVPLHLTSSAVHVSTLGLHIASSRAVAAPFVFS